MRHVIKGISFHGRYCLILIGPAEGFVLSAGQANKYQTALCGVDDCQCGGRPLPDPDAARVIWDDVAGVLRLVPASNKVSPAALLASMRPVNTYVCQHCGQVFQSRDTRAKFCGNRCRQADKYAREKSAH